MKLSWWSRQFANWHKKNDLTWTVQELLGLIRQLFSYSLCFFWPWFKKSNQATPTKNTATSGTLISSKQEINQVIPLNQFSYVVSIQIARANLTNFVCSSAVTCFFSGGGGCKFILMCLSSNWDAAVSHCWDWIPFVNNWKTFNKN